MSDFGQDEIIRMCKEIGRIEPSGQAAQRAMSRVRNELRNHRPAHARPWTRSILMKIGISSAAAAAIAMVIVLATGGGSAVAMADVLEQLRTKSYEFEMGLPPPNDGGAWIKGMVLEPGRIRLEQGGGLGPIVSIIDNNAKRSLILWERFKAAYRFDDQEKKDVGVLGFLTLPGRSIDDLWKLKAGAETKLGEKEVAGKKATGFRVTQKHGDYTETITIWADAKTAFPLRVDVTWQSKKDKKQTLELTLASFKVVTKPNVALFSTSVPKGYTMANRQTLEQLAKPTATSTSAAEGTSAQAKKILAASELWSNGKKQKGVEALMAVDWNDRIRFGKEHHLFTMTESQYISLVSTDQSKVLEEIMKQLSQYRAMARELMDLGKKAHAAKDTDKAEKYFGSAAGLGNLLDSNPDLMLIVRLVGISIQKAALPELSKVYEERGQPEKVKAVREALSRLADEQSKIKKLASGK